MDDLDALVRRVDEDRWLVSRFAPANVRARLIAIYAVNYEIARTGEVVSEPALGDIRLTWWREALEEIHAGKPVRAHPALEAYAAARGAAPLTLAHWQTLIEARRDDLGAQPFANVSAFEVYLDATAGTLMRLAHEACGAAIDEALVRACGRAWGAAGFVRAGALTQSRLSGVASEDMLRTLALAAHKEVRAMARPQADAFPALGYVALVPAYLRGRPFLLGRQLRLVRAAATGRL